MLIARHRQLRLDVLLPERLDIGFAEVPCIGEQISNGAESLRQRSYPGDGWRDLLFVAWVMCVLITGIVSVSTPA